MKFTVILEPEEDGGYSVHCPALPGCVSQGDNREEALENIKEAILGVLDIMAEDGEPVPKDHPATIAQAIREYLEDRSEYGLPLVMELQEVEIAAEVAA